ncbi:hypothetical protein [Paracoccus sp. (in: a-proteobacteria)]|uniref:hypothetical protein n=1 Tax=Paracoccus sp. TaxID=267 RepID=UPI0028A9BF3D|nr:hypothetical protein [Paracoccus sp. (in: a-proteobacteria)]
MPHPSHDSVRHRIETLRHWRNKNDRDAQIMADLLDEIERLEAKDARPCVSSTPDPSTV